MGRLGRAAPGAAALVLVLALAAWVRVVTVFDVLGTGEVIPPGDGDSAYHLSRILYAVERFPALPTVDPNMNWPDGAACPWADGFDLLGAALALATGGSGSPARAAVAAALLPVLLALLVAWATMDLARRVARRGPGGGRRATGVAFAAGVLAALAPLGVTSSWYGRIDHHVAEALSMLLLASWALARPGDTDRSGRARWELAGAGAATFSCWTFTGGTLYVALALALVLSGALRDRRARWIGSGAPALAAAAAVTALLTLPALRQHGRLVSFQLPSMLQPLLLALAGATLAAAVLVVRRTPAAGAWRRSAWLGVAALGVCAAVAAVVPSAAGELVAGTRGWLLRRDPWLASVQEFQPIWGGKGLVIGLRGLLGTAGLFAPLAVLAGACWAGRRAGARGWTFGACSAALLALAVFQLRFGRVFSPFLAVNVALLLEAAVFLALRAARRPRSLAAFTAVLAVALVAADPPLRGTLTVPAPQPTSPEVAASLALRRVAGETAETAPGVVTPWDFGHLVGLLSGRPVVVNGFGPYLEEETFWRLQRLVSMDADAFDALLERRRVGWVLAGAAYLGPAMFAQTPAGRVLAPEAMRELPMSPLAIAGSGVPDKDVPHLPRLMPFFASEQELPGFAFRLPWFWAYERVAGARVVGRAAPGGRVVVEVPFQERGRPHVYRAWADAGADGGFEVIVPLPTGFVSPSVRTAASAMISAGAGDKAPLAVPEAAVRQGGVVEAPPLRPPPR